MRKETLSSTQFKKLSAPTGSPFPPQLTSLQLIEVNSKIQDAPALDILLAIICFSS
jgi:hypothetical protein